mmetsp:Transcript_28550/g.51693  ORF Transcript_28550/g.51693 Transcript_28550/m.51693 type:complete len:671 (+) Transcript_28550:126-2138(+)
MQTMRCVLLFGLLLPASADSGLQKIIGMLDGMAKKVVEEGKAEDAKFEEFTALCEKRTDALNYDIQTGEKEVESLTAIISKATSKLSAVGSKLEELQASIAQSEGDLKAATEVRAKESEDFKAGEKDLLDVTATLERAMGMLEKQEKSGAFIQVNRATNVLQAVQAMMDASMIRSEDAKTLTSFLQGRNQDADMQPAAPPAYEGVSGGIMSMLEDMMDKSKDELSELRKKETSAKNSFALVVQSLKDEIKYGKEDVAKNMKIQGAQNSVKADAEKDLQETSSVLSEDKKTLSDFTMDCKSETSDHKEESESLSKELEALEAAKKALAESLPSTSFFQLQSQIHSSDDLKHFEVVRIMRNLGKEKADQQLVLLSRRVDAMLRTNSGADVFGKIKTMISDMIAGMQKALHEEASKKEYCDAEMKKATEKKDAKDAEIDDVSTKMDQVASKSADLKAQVADLQKALSTLEETKSSMMKLRLEEKAIFEQMEPETKGLIEGVKTALKVLGDFYKNSAATKTSELRTGAAGGIMGQLEDAESKAAMHLSEMRATEKSAAEKYETDMKDMKLEKVTKEKDVEYKTAEAKRLDAELNELGSDHENLATEMSAILEFKKGLDAECTVTPASFAEKQAKKQQEIDGLKTALSALGAEESGTSLLQGKAKKLRGRQSHLG